MTLADNEIPDHEIPDNAIAVIGIAGRFPGAGSVPEFWDNLRNGVESIVTLSEEDLTAAGVGPDTLADPAYVRRAALFSGVEDFDAEFFGMTPYAARMMDPQQRLFLQTAWHAFEDAGYDPADLDGAVGVFGTSSASGYLLYNLMSHRDPKAIIGEGATVEMVNLSLQNDKDHLATHVSHQFNLRGPSLSVQTACSSSLVAVHLACQSLLSGESDVALAGAASLRVPNHVGYFYEPGAMVSSVGHCRPFDVRADGTIFGSGVAAVVLKPLEAALDDGDRIHAVIRGSAVNNDGAVKMSYAAPNAAGQAEVIAEAHAVAGVDAASVEYVETHGTGTPLGDPVEIEGLRQAFEVSTTPRSAPCTLGSVKSNIGHLEVASGITGLVKAILCLENKAIPPTLHYTAPNPELHLERTPFVVRNRYTPWESEGPRRAGVSSFGVGGTNVHVVLEEAPQVASHPVPAAPQVLLLSGRTDEAVSDARLALAGALGDDAPALADVAYTLAGRRSDQIRVAAVVTGGAEAATVLSSADHDNMVTGRCPDGIPDGAERVAFLFPGQGAQHVGMAQGLYDTEAVFREHFDRCATGFAEELGIDLRQAVFAGPDLESTDLAQPALFAVEYALAQLIMSHGVTPTALAGHSIGELVAATLAGVFELPTALKVVALRARLMHAAPAGAMVAVTLGPDALAPHLTGDVDIAAVNDPGSCVVSGPEAAITAFTDDLAAQGILARRVRTSHGFHSQAMDGVLAPFAEFLSTVALHPPRIPLLSNVTGTWMTDAEAVDPARWAQHIRSTVRFADELATLLTEPYRVLVEVGPGTSLSGSAGRLPGWSTEHRSVRLMRHPLQSRADRDVFLLSLGQLWAAGVQVDWAARYGEHARRVTLPGYPFARQRHWIEPAQTSRVVPMALEAARATNGVASSPVDPRSQMQTALQQIWGQCLGLDTVSPGDNFFELGGDSLLAIGVAMTAGHQGVELTPQDLYDHHSLAALADTLVSRATSGGLSTEVPAELGLALPPNFSRFLDSGLGQPGRWRIPLVLRVDARVTPADVTAVLTAVVAHHDALRIRLVSRSGTWEQQIEAAGDFAELVTRTLPPGTERDSAAERLALADTVSDTIAAQGIDSHPLTATLITAAEGEPRFVVLTVHHTVTDTAAREVLVTDLLTAFAQQLTGEVITLQPVGTTWREWSQRCAALAAHPAVLDRRDYWIDNSAKPTLRLADSAPLSPPRAEDLVRVGTALDLEDTSAFDNARRVLRVGVEELLLAGLARAISARVGDGVVAVELAGDGRSVLKPDVDLRRTVGWFSTVYPIALPCVAHSGASAAQLIDEVSHTVAAVPHHGIGHGLLRYLHAPTAVKLAAADTADIFVSYLGMVAHVPPTDTAVQFDRDTELGVRETLPGLGHPIELRAYRAGGVLHVDWWYDGRRVAGELIGGLVDGFPAALSELIAAASADDDDFDDEDDDVMALVDLSAAALADDD